MRKMVKLIEKIKGGKPVRIKVATAITKQMIIIVSISIIILVVLAITTYSSLKINAKLREQKANAGKLYIVIERYDVLNFKFKPGSEPVILFEAEFSDDLFLDEIYENASGGYNHVHIENGMAKVIDANCRDKRCMHDYITNGPRFFELQGIKCMPHGLLIKWKSE